MALTARLVVSVMPALFVLVGVSIVYYTLRSRRRADPARGDPTDAESYGPVGYVVGILFLLVGAVPLSYL
ncbi:MAG: hypothetical protein V5A37_03385 [Halobacteriales archaeon]